MTLFKKEWHQWFAHASIELLEKNCVFGCFWLLSPLFVPKKELLPCSSLHRSLKKKAMAGALRSHHSLQKSDHEQIAPIAFYKRATMSDLLPFSLQKSFWRDSIFFKCESLFRSQKTSDLLKNRKIENEIPVVWASFPNGSLFTTDVLNSVIISMHWTWG